MTPPTSILLVAPPEVATRFGSYPQLNVGAGTRLANGIASLRRGDVYQAAYLDARYGSQDELWTCIELLGRHRVPTFLGLSTLTKAQRREFEQTGLSVLAESDHEVLVETLIRQLGLDMLASASGTVIAGVGSNKGGIGKTFLLTTLAYVAKLVGLRVLIVDLDIAHPALMHKYRLEGNIPSLCGLLQSKRAITPDTVRESMIELECGISVLFGATDSANAFQDMTGSHVDKLMVAVQSLGFDLVLFDCGPELKLRAYPIQLAQAGHSIVVPAPIGDDELSGVFDTLTSFARLDRDLTNRCLVVATEPIKARRYPWSRPELRVDDYLLPVMAHFPKTTLLGVLPRADWQVQCAGKVKDRYVSPIQVRPRSRFSLAAYQVASQFFQTVGLTPPLPLPSASVFQRLGDWIVRRPAPGLLEGAAAAGQAHDLLPAGELEERYG